MQRHNLETLSVLLVEDEEFMRDLIRHLLYEIRVREVISAIDGLDAETKVQSLKDGVGLIICDILMPNISGLQFVKQVREGKTSCNPQVPVLLLTGVGNEEVVKEASRVGINGYLRKPVSIELLRQRVTAAITQPMARMISDEADSMNEA